MLSEDGNFQRTLLILDKKDTYSTLFHLAIDGCGNLWDQKAIYPRGYKLLGYRCG
jgi:hypothetical protein